MFYNVLSLGVTGVHKLLAIQCIDSIKKYANILYRSQRKHVSLLFPELISIVQ